MDTPVLISHKTAWLIHHAPRNLVQAVAQRDYQIGVRGLSTQQRIARIRQALTDCGIPSTMLKTIDISVVFAFERIRANGVTCHVLGQNLPYDHIVELTPGIFITDEAFTFVLAAEWMDRIEYLEYGYEVCGDYRMGLNPSDPYTEQPATTSKDEIVELLDRHPGKPGATRARLALRHIYDHSASPMETASSIALSLPTSEGGVGIRGIELNKPLEIPQRLWHCTKARSLKIDALVTYQRRELGIEYKGGFHDETERKGADAEREAVLSQMGYRIVTLTSAQFASQLAFHRAMNSIREALGMPAARTPSTSESKTNCARHLSATGRARRAKTRLPSSVIPAHPNQNMYITLQNRHFLTSLEADVHVWCLRPHPVPTVCRAIGSQSAPNMYYVRALSKPATQRTPSCPSSPL